MPRELSNTNSNTRKRHRPSYKDHFPPLDEFGASEASNGNDDERRAKGDCGHGGDDHVSDESEDVAADTGGNERRRSRMVVLRCGRHIEQIPPTVAGEGKVTENSVSDKQNTRCNRCILIRRRCDNVRPVCGNCAKSIKACVYERASVTRAELERLAGRAGESGVGDVVAGEGGVRQRREVRGRGANKAWSLFEGFTDEEEEHELVALRMLQGRDGGDEVARTLHQKWSYADHLAFLRNLDRGGAIPGHGLFSETSAMLAEFQRQNGSIVDDWTRERYAGFRLIWDDPEEGTGVQVPHGANTGEGVLSSMRSRVGLPPLRRQMRSGNA